MAGLLQAVLPCLCSPHVVCCVPCREVNKGGLEGLYRVLLQDSADYFVAALRHLKSK